MTPLDFPRAFATAFGAQDAAGLAALFAEDGSFHALTGTFAESRAAIQPLCEAEFAGLSRMARLVTGKVSLRKIAPEITLLHQRFVVTGLRDQHGAEMPRVAALLTAVLQVKGESCLALHAAFNVVEG